MRNILNIILVFVFVGFLSCNNTSRTNEKDVLSVSIEPQKYFLESMVKDKYDVNSVIPSGSNPENFDPTPSQMVTLGKSKLYFKVGNFNFENVWIKNVQENSPELKVIDCSQGIETHEHHHDCDHGHGHAGGDPHIWSSPATATQMIKNMYDAMVESDPANKDFYTVNFEKLLYKIAETDSIVKSYIAKSSNKSFIIYHPALSYFAAEYGLNQLSMEHEGKNPSPAQMKELVDLATKENVKVVFIQQEFDSKNAEVVAREIGAKVVSLDLLSYNWDQEMIKIAKALSGDE